MGVVVEALHVQLGTLVAVKILRDDLAKQPHLVERFLREARAAAQLRGEHICRVHDFGTLDDGAPYMVMEMLQGRDLSAILKTSGTLASEVVAGHMIQACSAIAEAHALGMVHRDLKPGNLFLAQRTDGSPAIKVLDFGIAKVASPVDFSLTDTTNVMGSPAYMSPEQLRSSKNVDARSDIWSLGISMYELATQSQPFQGESITALTLSIANEPPAPLPATVPAAFAEVVARCLEKDPARRYKDVGELAAALAPCTTAQTSALATSVANVLTRITHSHEAVVAAPDDPAEKVTTLQGATGTVDYAPAQRRRTGMIAALAIGALAVGSVIFYAGVVRTDDASDEPRASSPAPTPTPPAPPPAAAPPPPPPPPLATTPVDAGVVEPVVVEPGVAPAVVAAPVTKPPPNKAAKLPKKATKPPKGVKPPKEDLGKSRY